jgi:hypothetical protein
MSVHNMMAVFTVNFCRRLRRALSLGDHFLLAFHVACRREIRSAYILVGKPEGKASVGRLGTGGNRFLKKQSVRLWTGFT